jgi:4-carboxymuconolactone decarboxylase
MTMNAKYKKGLKLLNQLHGEHTGKAIVQSMQDICPDYVNMTIEFGFADIFARPGLDLLTRELIVIASCVTLGHAMPQLKAHIEAAIEVGATKEQIVETILQMAPYAGFPAVTNAFTIAKDVLS